MNDQRGEIENRERMRQLISFSGMRWSNITPTDVDGAIDYHGKATVFYEFKYESAKFKRGQQLFLERQVEDAINAGKKSVAIFVRHSVHDTEKDVPARECYVNSVYMGNVWRPDKKRRTVQQFTDDFFEYVDKAENIGA